MVNAETRIFERTLAYEKVALRKKALYQTQPIGKPEPDVTISKFANCEHPQTDIADSSPQ